LFQTRGTFILKGIGVGVLTVKRADDEAWCLPLQRNQIRRSDVSRLGESDTHVTIDAARSAVVPVRIRTAVSHRSNILKVTVKAKSMVATRTYDTIRCGRFTCAQKLTRWPA